MGRQGTHHRLDREADAVARTERQERQDQLASEPTDGSTPGAEISGDSAASVSETGQPALRAGRRAGASEQGQRFAAWLGAVLVRQRYGTVLPNGQARFFISAFISHAAELGLHFRTDTINNTLRGYLPRPAYASELARALGLHPLAGLYHAGYVDLDGVAEIVSLRSLLGPQPLHLYSADAAYQADVAALDGIPDDDYREHLRGQYQQELAVSHRLRDALGLTYEEWQQFAARLNSEAGRDELRYSLWGYPGAVGEAGTAERGYQPPTPRLPRGYADSPQDAFSGPPFPPPFPPNAGRRPRPPSTAEE